MKFFLSFLIVIMSVSSTINSQTIVASYPFPNYSQYNSFWGITKIGDTLRIATDNNGSIYKVTTEGMIKDSLTTPFTFNHGLVWDGTGFWIAEQFRTAGARLFKVNTSGQRIDSILLPALIGGATGGVGDIALDGDGIWFSVYSPDFTTYPFAYAYKINLASRLITDTIPLRGRQVQGITVKGDTIFYVNDFFHTTPSPDPERIYAYSKSTGDTLFSFPTPDPDGNCSPRGLHWDGEYLWLVADRIGNNMFLYRTLYKYSITGQGNPQISTSGNILDFGNTIIGTTTDRTLTITNTGTAKLIITNYGITNPIFTITPNLTPDTLNPLQSKNYTVRFSPTAFDTLSAQLRITSNDGVTPVKIITLKGKGVYNGSYIASSVSSIDYQARRVNSLCGGYFVVTNQGSEQLIISSITLNTQRFRLDTVGLIFPVSIDTQKTKQFRVWFNPNSAVSFSDTAKINSNAVNNGQLKIPLTGSGQNVPTTLGENLWQTNIPDNPNTTSDDFTVASMKEIIDVNSDGVNDVIVCTENYWTLCYNGNSSVSADILWYLNTRTSNNVSGSVIYEDGMQIMEDINNDGIQDVAVGVGGNNELVYAVSGRTGQVLWTHGDSLIISDGDVNGVSVTKDYNNDGKKDVLVAASGEGMGNGRHAVICLNALNGGVIFNSTQNGEFTHSVTSTSTGGAIDFSFNGGPYGVNGFNNTGGTVWSYPVSSTVWNLKNIPDVNADGVSDIAGFVGFDGTTFVISGSNGSQIWSQPLGSSINGNIKLADDLSNDGYMDMFSSGPRSLTLVDSKTGSIKWTNPLDNNYIHGVDVLSDLTGNGIKEIVAGTQNSNLYVVNGDSGRILFTYNFGTATTNTVEQVARLKSIDGNISSEFLGGSRTGKLICFSGGPDGIVGITNSSNIVPEKFSLSQNYPNPFNPVTKIKFDLPSIVNNKLSIVSLKIFDVLGKEVETLVNEKLSPGSYEVEFNGSNFSSGIYFYKLEAENFSEVKRMILLK
ncbi:MAG: choice-of-anchor D domain-containing protein [Bacteroidota bacterium]|nr:choice-of-anchor D domain-containing protein [Bacteroidota bacterium]